MVTNMKEGHMYENANAELTRIVALADSCPEAYRPKAFEILLQGYVNSLGIKHVGGKETKQNLPGSGEIAGAKVSLDASVPPEVQTRLRSMAKRCSISPEALSSLFDFSSDPFTFAPVNVEGTGVSDRSKKVAMLVSARSFLATGKWQGDWAEIKAMCVHQNCYDVKNLATTLKKGKGDIFKSVEAGNAVELSGAGTEQAQQLLAAMSGQNNATEQ
jgi:hypothetical protein